MRQGSAYEEDLRRVEVRRCDDGRVVVAEEAEGPEVALAFGRHRHRHEVELPAESLPVLASRIGAAGAGEIVGALEEWMGERYLSELMDELDVVGIAYAYLADVGEAAVVRPAGSEAW